MEDKKENDIDKKGVEQEMAAQAGQQPTPQSKLDDTEEAATPEEIAAFLQYRRQQKEAKKHVETDMEGPQDPDAQKSEAVPNPYLEPDPEVPHVRYEETPFLWRGCGHCPNSYETVPCAEMCSCSKLSVNNWLEGIRQPQEVPFDCVEVRFKNNRKDFFRLPYGISVTEGDVVAVEGVPGHDVGIVSLTGELCRIQMQKKHVNPASEDIRKLFRRAKAVDIEKWCEAIGKEQQVLIQTRKITDEMGLVMKLNDIEFQGDNSKAIFYYTADERVDFRALIKVLAEEFHVRVEMKQIGVRQEAGKVGGIGTCGRELCCSTWLTNFKSVTTSVAKAQQILPNPQKLAGQCGKLKCCLNFEYEVYLDALKKFPPTHVSLRFQKGLAIYKKIDVFRGIMWYAYENQNDLYAIPAESVKEIIEKNKRQEYPEQLEDYQVELMSTSALEQETSEQEFEMAIKQLEDKGNEVVKEEDSRSAKREGNRGGKGGQRNDRGNRRTGQNRNQEGNRNTSGEGGNGNTPRQEKNRPQANAMRRGGEGAPQQGQNQRPPYKKGPHRRNNDYGKNKPQANSNTPSDKGKTE